MDLLDGVSGWSWRDLGPIGAQVLWDRLADWVGWLRGRYPIAEQLPACWWRHPELVEELTALWLAWRAAYTDPTAVMTQPAEWHDRWLPGLLHRVKQWGVHCDTTHRATAGQRVRRARGRRRGRVRRARAGRPLGTVPTSGQHPRAEADSVTMSAAEMGEHLKTGAAVPIGSLPGSPVRLGDTYWFTDGQVWTRIDDAEVIAKLRRDEERLRQADEAVRRLREQRNETRTSREPGAARRTRRPRLDPRRPRRGSPTWPRGWSRTTSAPHRHRLAYEAILRISSRGAMPDPQTVLAEVQADADARHNQVDGPFLQTLMQASPSAERIVLYAQMVVEASIHRTVALHAARIRSAADTDGAGDVVAERIVTTNDEALGMLDAVEKRWAAIGEDPNGPVTPEPERGRHSAQPVPAEAAVVASLLDDPAQIDELSRWLTPDDFTHPALRAVYAAALTVRARGDPADPVTVMWECHRHGAFTHRRFGADDLARLSRKECLATRSAPAATYCSPHCEASPVTPRTRSPAPQCDRS